MTAEHTRRALLGSALAGAAGMLSACTSGGFSVNDIMPGGSPPPAPQPQGGPQPSAIGSGRVKVGLVLPLTASGNAGLAGQSMKNAAELALAEFNNPDVQLLVKDDAGTSQGAQQAVQQALDEGAEIILGPLFAHSVVVAGQIARGRSVPVIAFSTDSNVASRGVFLLSFLPESDVERVVDYAIGQGKRSYAALVPDNAYGTVIEAAFKGITARKGARVLALERYPQDRQRMPEPVKLVAQAASRVDAIFIPDGGDDVPAVVQLVASNGVSVRRVQLIGTGLWDDPRIYADPNLQGGLFAAPDINAGGFRNFSGRYKSRFGNEPVRTATLAYDAVALVAALARTQGPQRFSNEVLTNPSGFAGIDGVFRFRADGTNERGLAVLRVTPSGPQVASPAPRAFAGT
jgi:branched-chain amino acid transport system substrate-binding protein